LTGIIVEGILKPGQTSYKPYIHNEEKYDYYYYVNDLSSRENRKWLDKMYFAPIHQDEIRRNPNLVQNPEWTNYFSTILSCYELIYILWQLISGQDRFPALSD
jgi:hypothetical protein